MKQQFITLFREYEGLGSGDTKSKFLTILTTFIHCFNKKPPYNKRVILVTDKGETIGKLVSTTEYGDNYEFEETNNIYWSGAKPIY